MQSVICLDWKQHYKKTKTEMIQPRRGQQKQRDSSLFGIFT